MIKEREICGVKVFVSGETYNEYKGTLQEQIEEKDKEIERLKGKLERIDCLIHEAINEREINGVGKLNLYEILELSGSDDNE